MNNLFGGVNNQKITEITTTDDGAEVKKMIETQVTFDASAKFEAEESEVVNKHDCLQCGVLFSRENSLALHKKEKHSRPDKVSFRTIPGVSTANLDWHTSFNNGASGVAYRAEDRKNSGSMTLEN